MLSALLLCALVSAREPWTVVIDPGHGGYQPGARAGAGKSEKQITLAVAERLKKQLEAKGLTVHLTRDSDKYVSLGGRSRFANEHHADAMLCRMTRSFSVVSEMIPSVPSEPTNRCVRS